MSLLFQLVVWNVSATARKPYLVFIVKHFLWEANLWEVRFQFSKCVSHAIKAIGVPATKRLDQAKKDWV